MSHRTYSTPDAIARLGGVPDDSELARLRKYYPSYHKLHRKALLDAMFDGTAHQEIVDRTIAAKGLEVPRSKQSRGGHAAWVVSKIKRATIRLLYLRYRLDDGLDRKQANQKLVQHAFFAGTQDAGQSSVRKATAGTVLDYGTPP